MHKTVASILGLFLASLLMLLTIGLPVSYGAVKKMKESSAHSKASQSDNDNPYSNSTEEKTPCNSLTVNEEYVHLYHCDFGLSPVNTDFSFMHTHEATYIAFHGELHCPPPNLLS